MSKHDRTLTLRLPGELYDLAEAVAMADGHSFSEMVRVAISEYIDNWRQDPGAQRRLAEYIARQEKIMERLR